jgi:O-antigen/teichoic acid export membrane protein
MSAASLHQKAVSATFWSAIDAFVRQGLQFLVTLFLARILSPRDFGTVGLLSVFIGLAAVVVDSGFALALVQKKEVSDDELSSVFLFNLGTSLSVAALLCCAAPWIAAFYAMPVLEPLTWLLAANLVVGALGTIQNLLLSRKLNLRRQCIISLTAQTISGAFAVLLAFRGFGVWSLGIQTLVASILNTLLLWVSSSWRPRLIFSISAIRSLFRFSSFLLLSSLLDTLFGRINSLIIGKFYSAEDLGYYSRADNTRLIPGAMISSIITRVAFPFLAASQNDKSYLANGLRRAATFAMMINFPLMLGMAVTAPSLVVLLFGEKWSPCVPYLQILSFAGLLWPLHVLNLSLLTALGHSNLFFRIEVVKKVAGILLLSIASFFGITAIAWSAVLAGVVAFVLNAHYSGRLVGYGPWRQVADLVPYANAALVMCLCTWSITLTPLVSPVMLLAVQILVGSLVYVGLCFVCRLPAFIDAWTLLRSLFFHHRARVRA